METDLAFERRRHQRYKVRVKATLGLRGIDDKAETIECTITSLSRYGIDLDLENGDPQKQKLSGIAFQLRDGTSIGMGLKVLRVEQSSTGKKRCACQLLFRDEEARTELHRFLKDLPQSDILERRAHVRRGLSQWNAPDRRGKDRRQHFGIFTESMAFAMRVPQWRSTYTYYQHVEGSDPGHVSIGGRRLISYSSKDYLGLAHDPRVKEASIKAIERYGTTAWSRVLNGTLSLHEDLERELADYKGTEAALLFSGGYIANITVLATLLKPGDVVFLDEHVHISLVDGSVSARARVVQFRHNDLQDLQRKIERTKSSRRLIIVDGVYSVEGDIPPLKDLRAMGDSYGIPLLVDDAHGIGVMGLSGSGTPEHFGLRGEIDLEVASFSAAFAGVGAFVACRKEVVDYLLHFSNGVMFTTSLGPGTLAGALEALRIMKTETARRVHLWKNVDCLKRGLEGLGYGLCPSHSAVVSIEVGNEELTYELVRQLEARGVAVNAFRRPAVKRGEAKLRLSVSAAHSEQDIDTTLQAFSDLKVRMESNIFTP